MLSSAVAFEATQPICVPILKSRLHFRVKSMRSNSNFSANHQSKRWVHRSAFVAFALLLALHCTSKATAQSSDFQPPLKLGEIPASALNQSLEKTTQPKKKVLAPRLDPSQQSSNSLQPISPPPQPFRTPAKPVGFSRPANSAAPLVQDSGNSAAPVPGLSNPKELKIPTSSEPLTTRPYYQLDPSHTSLVFAVGHGSFSFVYGRFNQCWGRFALDETNPARSEFSFTIDTESIDTNDEERDKHLRGPDFFDVQRHSKITFKSSSIAFKDGVYTAKGEMKMLGQTKEIEIPFQLLGLSLIHI